MDCSDVFSDVLHRPFQCANVDIQPFVTDIPKINEIERLSDLTEDDFSLKWVSETSVLIFFFSINLLDLYAGENSNSSLSCKIISCNPVPEPSQVINPFPSSYFSPEGHRPHFWVSNVCRGLIEAFNEI